MLKYVAVALLAVAVVAVFILRGRDVQVADTPTAPPAPRSAHLAPPPVAPAASPDALAVDAGNDDEDGDNVLEIDLTANPNFFAMLAAAGIEDAEEKLAAWGLARGYPQFDDQGNALLDQPYDQYDDETLRAFADSGDMWAQQILAERLAETRPAEALELYRLAAINGSVHAMTEMARLYRQLSATRNDTRFGDDAEALQQLYALRDGSESLAVTGYAWAAAAEKAGWDPLRGGMTASFVGSKLSDEQLAAACDFAGSIYDELVAERAGRGLDGYDRQPPPVVFDAGATSTTVCYDEQASGYLSTCQEIRVKVADQSSRFWKCDE